MVQEMVADSWLELEQFRLLLIRTAWKIDKLNDYNKVRADISAVKSGHDQVCSRRIADRALQVHGSFGVSDEAPFVHMILNAYHVGLADGPTEVHKSTLWRKLLLRNVDAVRDRCSPSYTRSLKLEKRSGKTRRGDEGARSSCERREQTENEVDHGPVKGDELEWGKLESMAAR